MDSYVIRIYRRDENEPKNVVGVVEFVEQEKTKSFAGIDELVQMLTKAADCVMNQTPGSLAKK